MARLSMDQIAAAAHAAGFRGRALVEITAIAMAESTGDPNALNPRGEYSVGLTQINMNAHGTRFGTASQLRDPVHNMRAAYQLSGGGRNFRPWSVHRSSPSPHAGSSDRFLGQAAAAARRVVGGNIPDVPTGGGGGGGSSAPGAGGPSADALLRQQEQIARQQREQEQLRQIEAREAQAMQAHQSRMLQFMDMMTRQNQGRGRPIPVRSAVQVDEREFDPSGVTERLRRLTPQDLTPGVARRSPVDRAAMLKGMGQHLQRAGR